MYNPHWPDNIALAIAGSTATFVAIIETMVRLDKLVSSNPKPFSLRSSQPLNETYTNAYEINLTRTTLVICDNPTSVLILILTTQHKCYLSQLSYAINDPRNTIICQQYATFTQQNTPFKNPKRRQQFSIQQRRCKKLMGKHVRGNLIHFYAYLF